MLYNRLLSTALVVNTFNFLRTINVCGETMSHGSKYCSGKRISYLTQADAAALDQELFTEYKFSVDQLMELAGLSVATAVARAFPPETHSPAVIICGPGNNGGDGLVAARHMMLFGYTVAVYYPKRTPKPLYENLLEQCKLFGVNILETLPNSEKLQEDYKLMVDALFGFSFKPPVRSELIPVMKLLTNTGLPVVSVDIPSGWDVERGPVGDNPLKPAMLVSLSAPKLCARPEILRDAKHYLGGRFLPPKIIEKFNLTLPNYLEQDQVAQLSC